MRILRSDTLCRCGFGMSPLSDGRQEIVLQRLSDRGGQHRAGNHLNNAVKSGEKNEHLCQIHGADLINRSPAEIERGGAEEHKEEQHEEQRIQECGGERRQRKSKQALPRFLQVAEQVPRENTHQQAGHNTQHSGLPRTDAKADYAERAHAEALHETGDSENQAQENRSRRANRGGSNGNRNGHKRDFDDPDMEISERGEGKNQFDCREHCDLHEFESSFISVLRHGKNHPFLSGMRDSCNIRIFYHT